MRLGMVTPADHQPCSRQLRGDDIKRLNHQFEAFVRSPFAEGQNAMSWIPTARQVGKFRTARKNAVRTQVNVVSPVLVVEDFAIAGHENRDRVRQQQHTRSQSSRQPVGQFIANSSVPQVNGIHQMMQRNVGVAATQAREQRRHETAKGHQRISAECTEEQIEPDNVRFETLQCLDQIECICRIVERPAAENGKALRLNEIPR